MRARGWFRTAACLLGLFAALHTVGFLLFKPATEEGRNVWTAMNSVQFQVGAAHFSYGGFYMGFGLFVTAALLFLTWLTWTLGTMVQREWQHAKRICWALVAFEIVSLGLALRYFSIGPAIMSGLTAFALVMGALRSEREAA